VALAHRWTGRVAALHLPWPLPALLAWAASWAVFIAATQWLRMSALGALLPAAALSILLSWGGDTRWRRIFIACGFPLSLGVSGAIGDLPPWAWLLPLALLAAAYPMHAWRDAPLFPTPAHALTGLARLVPLPVGARVMDAGCGLGAGLAELHREYPQAHLAGLEWSWPLRMVCGWRARYASVRRADIWRADWSGCDMVYLFQRPESMPRAAAKAARDLRAGAWMASLEFEANGLVPDRVHDCPDGRRLWLYQAPFTNAAST
jgi:hypothetical protein